jgi:hypothetical protein
MFFEGAKQLGQDARGLKLTMGGGEQLPETTPGLSQLGQQLWRNLADRLRFTSEFGQIVAIDSRRRPNPTRGWITLSPMHTNRTCSTPMKAVARSRAQRDGVEYQAPSTLTSARELISTVIGSLTSNGAVGKSKSCSRSSFHNSARLRPSELRRSAKARSR